MSELKPRDSRACPECGRTSLYQTTSLSGTPHANLLLPGLGGFFRFATVQIRVCSDCGLARYYADPEALTKLRSSARWTQL